MDSALAAALLDSTVTMSVPLLLAALGEVVAERSGILNIGVEGILLAGAFAAMAVCHLTGSPWLGVVGAWGIGLLLAGLFGSVTIYGNTNQVVAGVALNLMAAGLTGVLYRAMFGVTGTALSVAALPKVAIPGLSALPIVGPALFSETALGYLTFCSVFAVWYGLYRTIPGLKLRMVGENPRAAAAQGVDVRVTQLVATLIGGWFAATAGAFLVVAYTRTFVEGMSAGRGFIALGIVIFGRWNPLGAAAASLVFGFATALQFHAQAQNSVVPYQALLALPYLLTLAVLASAKARTRAPAALGSQLSESHGA